MHSGSMSLNRTKTKMQHSGHVSTPIKNQLYVWLQVKCSCCYCKWGSSFSLEECLIMSIKKKKLKLQHLEGNAFHSEQYVRETSIVFPF